MHGVFKLDAKNGPPVGTHRLHMSFSGEDVPSLTEKDAPEGAVQVDKFSSSDTQDATATVKEGTNKFNFELKYP
jgi:hypothetical protein